MERRNGRRDHQADVERIGQVLDGLLYPAARWQVIAQADHYGADAVTRAQLVALPVRAYVDLGAVLAALGLFVPDRRRRTGTPASARRRA